MANVTQYKFVGSSIEVKPTTVPGGGDLIYGAEFYEADTGNYYYWNEAAWVVKPAADLGEVVIAAGTAVDVSSDVVASFTAGGGVAATGTAARILAAASAPSKKGVLIKADDDNTGSIYLGHASTTTADAGGAASGTRLKAGQSLFVPVSNRNLIYLIGSAASQNYTWMVC